MRKQSPFDTDSVRQLANLLAETDLTEIEVQKGDLRVRVARNFASAATPVAVAAPRTATPEPSSPNSAAAPAKGGSAQGKHRQLADGRHRLSRPAPEARPFVELGAAVKPGDKLLLDRGHEDLQRDHRAALREP